MINIFNRQELIITLDKKRQAEVREILFNNEIKYTIKTTNLQSPTAIGSSRAYTGSFGINQDYIYEYKIYVHKKDYEKAVYLIR